MPLAWTELALIVLIAVLVARPWSRAIRDAPPERTTWRDWTLAQRLAIAVGLPLIAGYWIHRDYQRGGLAGVLKELAIAAAVYLVIRLLKRPAEPRSP